MDKFDEQEETRMRILAALETGFDRYRQQMARDHPDSSTETPTILRNTVIEDEIEGVVEVDIDAPEVLDFAALIACTSAAVSPCAMRLVEESCADATAGVKKKIRVFLPRIGRSATGISGGRGRGSRLGNAIRWIGRRCCCCCFCRRFSIPCLVLAVAWLIAMVWIVCSAYVAWKPDIFAVINLTPSNVVVVDGGQQVP